MNILDLEKKMTNSPSSQFIIIWPFFYLQSLGHDWYAMNYHHPIKINYRLLTYTHIKLLTEY